MDTDTWLDRLAQLPQDQPFSTQQAELVGLHATARRWLTTCGYVRHPISGVYVAAGVWATNVIAFAVVFWEIDRGGPFARRFEGVRDDAPMDFRFPQEEGSPGLDPRWRPEFFDYLYFSLNSMMAFSPTDVMPLTRRAKALMGYESLTGFVLLALVIARAVNIIS